LCLVDGMDGTLDHLVRVFDRTVGVYDGTGGVVDRTIIGNAMHITVITRAASL
jgi:hypothetical protein